MTSDISCWAGWRAFVTPTGAYAISQAGQMSLERSFHLLPGFASRARLATSLEVTSTVHGKSAQNICSLRHPHPVSPRGAEANAAMFSPRKFKKFGIWLCAGLQMFRPRQDCAIPSRVVLFSTIKPCRRLGAKYIHISVDEHIAGGPGLTHEVHLVRCLDVVERPTCISRVTIVAQNSADRKGTYHM